MSGSPPFRHDLMESLSGKLSPGHADVAPRPVPVAAGASAGARRLLKKGLRPLVARFIQPRIAREVQSTFDALYGTQVARAGDDGERLNAIEVNAEMLKAELRSVNHDLQQLAAGIEAMSMAIAPTAGLAGVPDRLAELRERLNAVERRTRVGTAPTAPAGPGSATANEVDSLTPSIDYVGFERRFRGDPAEVLEVTRSRYLDLLRDHAPVLDVGCGKGELVSALSSAGIAATGIDLDAAMVDEAQALGLDVHVADLNTFLEQQAPRSLGAIISTQVVEHLQVSDLVRFLDLSASRLRPGGVFIAETPNPASLIVLGTHFILDPTHVRPIHPALMVYLCECSGFHSVELKFYEPARQYHLKMLAGNQENSPLIEEINANFVRLNDVLFGPQDYAVVARTAGPRNG